MNGRRSGRLCRSDEFIVSVKGTIIVRNKGKDIEVERYYK